MEPAKKKPKRNSKHDTEGEEKPPFTCQQRWNLDKLQHCSQLILDPKSSQPKRLKMDIKTKKDLTILFIAQIYGFKFKNSQHSVN